MKLDEWQQKVMDTKGNIVLRSGRQTGKSTVISIKAGEFAVNNPKTTILMIASVERQAYLLFEKTLAYLFDNYRNYIKKGKDRPTKSKINLTNGSTIYCLPTGLTGHGIRGYTVDLLVADEAAFIPDEVWRAVTPMLATSRRVRGTGDIILLSTPYGKGGYFYECFNDPTFTSFHVSSEDCPRIDKNFLEREKATMSKLQYAQEYLGEFIDELRQFFPTELIKKCMSERNSITSFLPALHKIYMGVDVARLGGDETVLVSMKLDHRGNFEMVDIDILRSSLLTETVERIKHADRKYKYDKIYIDDGGLGVGVFDPLLVDKQTKRKVVAINNASRSIDKNGRKKKTLKEDLYNNLLYLMERGKVKFFDKPEIMLSLKSVQAEYTESGRLKIFGNYTHIAEALIRAVWAAKDKSLNIYCVY